MGTVRRKGKWTLEKDREGVYAICERGDMRARVLTAAYEPAGPMDSVGTDMMTETIEVETRSDAQDAFFDYVEDVKSGGGGPAGLF